MAARLSAAGYADSDIRILAPEDRPRCGNLIATLQGSDPAAPAILLLAHTDVVEANPADWTREPFTLIEEDGYFYARGSSDDKAQASVSIREVAARMWPNVPILPTQTTGATDGRFTNSAGIPTYGATGMFADPACSGAHGFNERIRVRSLYEGRDFLFEIVKRYAMHAD